MERKNGSYTVTCTMILAFSAFSRYRCEQSLAVIIPYGLQAVLSVLVGEDVLGGVGLVLGEHGLWSCSWCRYAGSELTCIVPAVLKIEQKRGIS